MSINLHFETHNGEYPVPFPVQTPTALSYRVMNAETIEQKLRLIRDWLEIDCKWDPFDCDYTMTEIEQKMRDPTLRLTAW